MGLVRSLVDVGSKMYPCDPKTDQNGVPDTKTRRNVWELYLGGKPLDLIADLTGISQTSVFNIVRDKGSHDPDHVLMRTLAVNLRKNGPTLAKPVPKL